MFGFLVFVDNVRRYIYLIQVLTLGSLSITADFSSGGQHLHMGFLVLVKVPFLSLLCRSFGITESYLDFQNGKVML